MKYAAFVLVAAIALAALQFHRAQASALRDVENADWSRN
jgi:hypothetical protein